MNTDVKTIENRLKDLMSKNEDAVKGFKKAADNAKDKGVKAFFERRAKQRALFLKTFRNAAPDLDLGSTALEGSAAGQMHRAWMDVKSFFTADDDEAMLEEAVRGDKAAVEEYNDVLTETMVPQRLKEIIREQRDEIKNDLETSKILEDVIQ
ncbi:ferritin-like domain-containing protein [Maribacter sp. 2307ULW6-5]|uniref:ferritin-like domain-containing protein n=1 Tax=Maribacter sp. 2307ULW6-5 TaxID=3386275 RepID=UPI0039BD4C7D